MPGEEEKLEQKSEEQQEQQEQGKGIVQLKEEDYAKMVTQMGEMQKTIEQMMERESRKEQYSREQAEAQREKQQSTQEPVDLNELDNNQLAQFLVQHIHETMGDPLLKMVATQSVREERKELISHMKDSGETPETLQKVEKEVLDLVMKRPQLSLIEGYKLIKSERKTEDKKSDDKEREKTPVKQFAGERPGGTKTQFTPSGKMSLDEATAKALEGYQET